MKKFRFYQKYFDKIQSFAEEEKTVLLIAVTEYGLYGKEPDIEAGTDVFKCFEEIKTDIDKQKKKKGAK